MKDRPEGDGLFEALRSELRGIMAYDELPDALQSKDQFDEWKQEQLGLDEDDKIGVDRMRDIEALFGGECKIVVTGDGQYDSMQTSGQAQTQAKADSVTTAATVGAVDDEDDPLVLQLKYEKGQYYSQRYPRSDAEVEGLRGLEFWLQSLSINLPTVSDNNSNSSIAIFVVGTHLDEVDGKDRDIRQHNIKKLADRIGVKYPLHIHEVSCIDLAGIEELQRDLYSTIAGLGHMGEQVPNTYIHIANEVKKMAAVLDEQKSKFVEI